jgi:hypothetical protein
MSEPVSIPLPEEVLERMARAVYAAKCTRPDPHPVFMRWSSWDDACKIDGWRDERLREAQACWDASPGPVLSRVEAENGRLADTARRLALFVRDAAREGWEGNGFDGAEIQDTALKYGLFKCEPYDPDKHGESGEVDVGEDWYTFADDVQAILPKDPDQ